MSLVREKRWAQRTARVDWTQTAIGGRYWSSAVLEVEGLHGWVGSAVSAGRQTSALNVAAAAEVTARSSVVPVRRDGGHDCVSHAGRRCRRRGKAATTWVGTRRADAERRPSVAVSTQLPCIRSRAIQTHGGRAHAVAVARKRGHQLRFALSRTGSSAGACHGDV